MSSWLPTISQRLRGGDGGYLHVRIDAGNTSILYARRQRREPSLGLPFCRVFAPYRRVPVDSEDADYDVCIIWNSDFCQLVPFYINDGRREWQDDVTASAISSIVHISKMSTKLENTLIHVLVKNGTGG